MIRFQHSAGSASARVTGIGSYRAFLLMDRRGRFHCIWPGPGAAIWFDGTNGQMLDAMRC